MKKPEKKNKTTEIIVFDDSIHFRRLNVHDIKKRNHQFTKLKYYLMARKPFKNLFNGVYVLIYYLKNIYALLFYFNGFKRHFAAL